MLEVSLLSEIFLEQNALLAIIIIRTKYIENDNHENIRKLLEKIVLKHNLKKNESN